MAFKVVARVCGLLGFKHREAVVDFLESLGEIGVSSVPNILIAMSACIFTSSLAPLIEYAAAHGDVEAFLDLLDVGCDRRCYWSKLTFLFVDMEMVFHEGLGPRSFLGILVDTGKI